MKVSCETSKRLYQENKQHDFLDSLANCFNHKGIPSQDYYDFFFMILQSTSIVEGTPRAIKAFGEIKKAITLTAPISIKEVFFTKIVDRVEKVSLIGDPIAENTTGQTAAGWSKILDEKTREYQFIQSLLIQTTIDNQLNIMVVDTGAPSSSFPSSLFTNSQASLIKTTVGDIHKNFIPAKEGFLKNVQLFGLIKQKFLTTFTNNSPDEMPILGLDFLMKFNNFCIDSRGLSLNVDSCSSIKSWQPMQLSPRLKLTVDILLDGAQQTMLIDTGSSSNLINYSQLNEHQLNKLNTTEISVTTISGANSVSDLTVQSTIYQLTFDNNLYSTKYEVVHNSDIATGENYSGLLGLEFFYSFESIMFDFKNMRLGLGKRKTKTKH